METIAVLIVLVVVILAPLIALTWLQRRARGGQLGQGGRVGGPPAAGAEPAIGWSDARAGDRIVWSDEPEGSATVLAVIDCREERNDRVFGWRWIVLEGERLVEYRGSRLTWFDPPILLAPDSPEFATLAGADGALAAFESRARLSWEPVSVSWQGRTYQVTGTGSFAAWSEDPLSGRPVWQGISHDPKENVYFALEGVGPADQPTAPASAVDPSRAIEPEPATTPEGAIAPEGAVIRSDSTEEDLILGVWTDELALYPCRRSTPVEDARLVRPPE